MDPKLPPRDPDPEDPRYPPPPQPNPDEPGPDVEPGIDPDPAEPQRLQPTSAQSLSGEAGQTLSSDLRCYAVELEQFLEGSPRVEN